MIVASKEGRALNLDGDGAELWLGAASGYLSAIMQAVESQPADHAGLRLTGIPALTNLLNARGAIGALVARHLRPATRPVRMILFDKSAATNWALGWHQDRTIVVRNRAEVSGFGPWTTKAGLHHVAPPIELLERMMTIRIHLDRVPGANAPLLIAPGSHLLGRVREAEISAIVERLGMHRCLAEAGDIWAYATPILHASDAAREPGRRRVLQVDYAAEHLSGGLEWLGI
ncbi:phytanoyl-CoA dioxygenase family protein [Sphingomonas pruni]|uniref:phytanoyl-CoA dioxygenase family protein n=1 Tax=Sphingomonas pruni TaxID=40683 RepID=UPI000AB9E06A|nr:phytanoyl-CoA dioxygenase family protein [Sphingomonas pruni]